jgi:hypothetical protein
MKSDRVIETVHSKPLKCRTITLDHLHMNVVHTLASRVKRGDGSTWVKEAAEAQDSKIEDLSQLKNRGSNEEWKHLPSSLFDK